MNIKILEPYDLNSRYDIRSLTPNPGPVVIASLLKQNGHEVEVISEYVTKLNLNELKDADLIGISITTYNANKGYKIARQINKPVVFGGFHASLMTEECLDFGDYVIRGDGHSIVKLADYSKLLLGSGRDTIGSLGTSVKKKKKRVHFGGEVPEMNPLYFPQSQEIPKEPHNIPVPFNKYLV